MLCGKCWGMLRGHEGKTWKGTYDLHFNHHSDLGHLQASAASLCGICRRLYDTWTKFESTEEPVAPNPPQKFSSTAGLTVVRDVDEHDLFRLDFLLKCGKKTRKRTFVLRQTDESVTPFKTPVAKHMSSAEVFQQAVTWYSKCKCAKSRPEWHPTRLIDLQNLKSRVQVEGGYTTVRERPAWETLQDETIRVVEKGDEDFPQTAEGFISQSEPAIGVPDGRHNRYVTLSHCWGTHRPMVLNTASKAELKRGFRVVDLPATYQQAIHFAAQMEDVGWIWIDSLCIIQDDDKDWTQEAAAMQRVYRESFLNISATASNDSSESMYRDRVPRTLWEDEINLNIDGIYGPQIFTTKATSNTKRLATQPAAKSMNFNPMSGILGWFWSAPETGVDLSEKSVEHPVQKDVPRVSVKAEGIRRCILVDVTHWDDTINTAPVNRRAWVLQERLLAPRVLHFCDGQIAWECGEFEESEGHPTDIPKFIMRDDRVLPKPLNKGLTLGTPELHGQQMRNIRLRGEPETDEHLIGKGLYELELWSQIVEQYSRLDITMARDKLVALSGIAEFMATEVIGSAASPEAYFAGLWGKYLASQLLWKIEPIFDPSDRSFQNPSRRPRDQTGKIIYRAPSFSWASVDAQFGNGNGIICGEITDQDLLLEVDYEQSSMTPKVPGNVFGEVTGGHAAIRGQLRKIILFKGDSGRYHWTLQGESEACPPGDRRKLEREEHRNVYLDCPDDDLVQQDFGARDVFYCVPAALGSRTEAMNSKYIICLLLRHVPQSDDGLQITEESQRCGVYRRIGLTKLSTWIDKYAHQHIRESLPMENGALSPNFGAHSDGMDEGLSLIRII